METNHLKAKIVKPILILGLLMINLTALAKDKCFSISSYSPIYKNNIKIFNADYSEINFELSKNELKINVPLIGTFEISSNFIFNEKKLYDSTLYIITGKSKNGDVIAFSYCKDNDCSPENPSKNIFYFQKNYDFYEWEEGIWLYNECNNPSNDEQELIFCTPEEDSFVKFILGLTGNDDLDIINKIDLYPNLAFEDNLSIFSGPIRTFNDLKTETAKLNLEIEHVYTSLEGSFYKELVLPTEEYDFYGFEEIRIGFHFDKNGNLTARCLIAINKKNFITSFDDVVSLIKNQLEMSGFSFYTGNNPKLQVYWRIKKNNKKGLFCLPSDQESKSKYIRIYEILPGSTIKWE